MAIKEKILLENKARGGSSSYDSERDEEECLTALRHVAEVLEDLKEWERARQVYSHLLERQRQLFGQASPEACRTCDCLAGIALSEGRLADAETGPYLYTSHLIYHLYIQ